MNRKNLLASMGPPIFIGGNAGTTMDRRASPVASMGPPIFIGGNSGPQSISLLNSLCFNGATDFHRWKSHARQPPPCRYRGASMGPPIFIGGNVLEPAHALRRLRQASMGPPIFIGGNETAQPLFRETGTGFNGATDFHRWKSDLVVLYDDSATALQWGHRFSSVEIARTLTYAQTPHDSFNGATDFHRWKSPVPNSKTPLHLRFNGATDFHRWKWTSIGMTTWCTRASMGPPIFIGGNHPGRRGRRGRGVASMGPPIFIGGNAAQSTHPRCAVLASMGPPIFIGGNERHENRNHWRRRASMGPPIFIGGNGHLSAVPAVSPPGFNGATDFHRWKLPILGVEGELVLAASMGPPIFIGGNTRAQAHGQIQSPASMGPPIFIGGNSQIRRRMRHTPNRLNGATDFHRWK